MEGFVARSTSLAGLIELVPKVFADQRGYFFESYNARALAELGISTQFVQDNESHSKCGVLRGLHMQITEPQAKLVRVVFGEIFDVAVDVRVGSITFGLWHGVVLSDANKKQLYIPEGFLHGFLVLSPEARFLYKCSGYYNPGDEFGVQFDDKDIAIRWPNLLCGEYIINEKDQKNGSLAELKARLERGVRA